MAKENLSYAIFYPAKSYEEIHNNAETRYITELDLQKYFKVDNYPPTNWKPTAVEKKEEFLSLMKDDEHDVLMAWYGGQVKNGDISGSSFELVRELTDSEWNQIINSKKKVVGRSDITFLLCKLLQQGVRCYYGPNYSSFANDFKEDSAVDAYVAEKNIETTKKYLELALTSTKEYVVDFKDKEVAYGSDPWILRGGQCTGRLIGGNLDTICDMISGLDKKGFSFSKGDILLIESLDPLYAKPEIAIDKSSYLLYKLNVLKEIGVFDCIYGLIFGKSKTPTPIDGNGPEKEYLREAVELIIDKKIPVLANVSCSHTTPMITLPLGRMVTLNADECTLTIHQEWKTGVERQ